jgi:hypothetical protein
VLFFTSLKEAFLIKDAANLISTPEVGTVVVMVLFMVGGMSCQIGKVFGAIVSAQDFSKENSACNMAVHI